MDSEIRIRSGSLFSYKEMLQLSRQDVCEFGSALCDTIRKETGKNEYHGGIYPGNIRAAESTICFIEPGRKENWTEDELYFIAPELFWGGTGTPASDVYSVGMLLYYCITGGRLPFMERGVKVAARSRMEGEEFEMPRNAGVRLGKILQKACAFRAEDRYASVAELKVMLDSCVENRFVEGGVSGSTVFGKNEEQLSDLERMMLSIIESNDQLRLGTEEDPVPEEPEPENRIPENEDPAEEETPETTEPQPESETPAAGPEPVKASHAETARHPYLEPISIHEPFNPPETEPAVITVKDRRKAAEIEAAVEEDLFKPVSSNFNRNLDREKKIADCVRKRRRRPLFIVAALAILLISFAILVNASKGVSIFGREEVESNIVLVEITPGINVEATVISPDYVPEPTPTPTPPPPTPTPDVPLGTTKAITDIVRGSGPVIEAPGTSETEYTVQPEPAPQQKSTYEIFIGDVSWVEAKLRCEEKGGHLVVINDQEEFNYIASMANSIGKNYVWIGCSRNEGEMTWVTGETVNFWAWDNNEPSGIDAGTGEIEDYVMLWFHGRWCYNDMIMDPARDYSSMYSGKIAYVCEYEP